jgi:hypothetical protein
MTGILDESSDRYFATDCTGDQGKICAKCTALRRALLGRNHAVNVTRPSQISFNKVFYLELQLFSQVLFVAFFFLHRRKQQSCIISIKR